MKDHASLSSCRLSDFAAQNGMISWRLATKAEKTDEEIHQLGKIYLRPI
jgi:hypothetical protein